MKQLLEAINRGILRGLYENNIELLTDLDDGNLDQLDSLQTKNINHKIFAYTYFPKTKEELIEIIKAEVEKKGWDCNLNHIDVSRITDMSYLFSDNDGYGLTTFNGDISRWDVSNVTDMRSMFAYTEKFNQPIGGWDVSNVENMNSMFAHAKSFNQHIGNWDVSNVKDISFMFSNAESFNQPIEDWNVSNVEGMKGMFYNAQSFNQPIGGWDVSKVFDMTYMFYNAKSFNHDLSKWKLKSYCGVFDVFIKCPIKEEYKPKGIKEYEEFIRSYK